jgi:urocanate hydratase
MAWDVMGGVARRAWARNKNSITTSIKYNKENVGRDHITLPYIPDEKLIEETVYNAFLR